MEKPNKNFSWEPLNQACPGLDTPALRAGGYGSPARSGQRLSSHLY